MIKLTLDIYVPAGHPYYNKSICELTYDNFKLKKDNDEWSTHYFPTWDTIQAEIKEEILINNEEYYQIEFCADIWNRFYVLKSDIQKLNEFCDKRNYEMSIIQKSVYSYIDTEILDIAENLLNIAEENVMLNYHIVGICHFDYSHLKSRIFKIDTFYKASYYNEKNGTFYSLLKSTYGSKGKAKKDAENFNNELLKKINEFSKLIDNFVEIITDNNKVNEYIAKAVAWEAIQRKAIDYYSQQWIEEYEPILDNTFDELHINFYNQDIDKTIHNYIKSVLLCNEIDIEHSQEILMYFLLSKRNIEELILCDCFVEHYETIKELQQNIDSSDIKQKLKTKQQRKVTKYTIDDIDLMTGAEFEEFIALLFKKMGYSSQVTKQSGDQGIDVIAIKNNTRIGIQAKCYSNTVGNAAIQEAVAGKSFYYCDKTVVVTNNYFTTAAIELAQANNVILWNRDLLKEKIKELL